MATKYADIANLPNDLLTDDFTTKTTLKCKKAAGPVAVTIETVRGSGGALSAKVGGKFLFSGLSFDKVQLTADGGAVMETSLIPAAGFKLLFKGGKAADLGVEYTQGGLCLTETVDVKNFSQFTTSGCVSLESGTKLGGSATYATSGKTGISAASVGGSYTSGNLFAALTTSGVSTTPSFHLGLCYTVNPSLTLASTSTHTSSKPLQAAVVGGAYLAPQVGTIKAKVDPLGGIASAALVREIAPKVLLTVSGTMKGTDVSTFKYGIGVAM